MFSFDSIPDQTGRVAIVTGANSGIGYETARMLAQKGAHVVLACRSAERGRAAVGLIVAGNPPGRVELSVLDLSDLDSVAAFAERFIASHDRLDLLVNNAGVMVPPFSRTKQGFEMQFGTNHLGHFALTGRLLPLLERTAGSRVVVVSSSMHRSGTIDLDDPNYERRRYWGWPAYGQSKLANLLFARELQKRLGDGGPMVTASHPGFTATELQRSAGYVSLFNFVAMKPSDGAMPTIRAATDPGATRGSYWGPAGLFEINGAPVEVGRSGAAKDDAVAAQLWALSEKLTGVSYDFGGAA
ncbi:MAG: SDR family NAD(P)-dependent oxidoreductase [Deltaproteobacteria bacterium]|nr:SDR family NAD(P)-dependent oxidoreductase [Deltaproteobacteria bacterium]